MTARPRSEDMLERERIANRAKHWVRLVTACNSRCLFCLDADTPRNVILDEAEIHAELDRGLHELGADKVILSGGEASLHPRFFEIVRYAKDQGYDRVQTVTNGWRYAERTYYESAIRAGLGEITFSLHGHTEALHDELTQHPGSFKRISKAILRAVRDPRVIANVDVVINAMNVEHIDAIVEYAMRLGIREFDLLHVIPQANAFDNRDRLFYDVAEHLPRLHKVFRLNRHPGVVVWTNRFPVPWLEGMEDLIQDPHKMLDEVNGRRFMVRNYLDTGKPLECRDPRRCPHCFIEPFCNTMDDVSTRQAAEGFAVWWVGEDVVDPLPPPPGVTHLGVAVPTMEALVAAQRPGLALYAAVDEAGPPPELDGLVLVADTAEKLEAWWGHRLEVRLNRATAPWLLANADRLSGAPFTVHQPGHEKLAEAAAADVRDPAAFFTQLGVRVRVSGLPACGAPGMELVPSPALLPASLYDPETGRLRIRALARYHVQERYRAKSVRCRTCPVSERCEGFYINQVRDQGLALCRPLEGAAATDAAAQLQRLHPTVPVRVGAGRAPVPPAPSLPGFAMPQAQVADPLEMAARAFAEERRRRREERARKARGEG